MEKEKDKSSLVKSEVRPEQKTISAPAAALETKAQASRRNRRRRLTGIVFIFFLLSVVLFMVPVRLIPGLRVLAGYMGWSELEGYSFSFARAFLTWSQDGSRTPADAEGFSLFNRQNSRWDFSLSGARSSLFNLRQANAARRAQGLPEDRIAGVYEGEEQSSRAALNRSVTDWSQEAQRNASMRERKEDVFLGEDVSVVERAMAQAADKNKGSANSALLVPKAPLTAAGTGKTNWLNDLADRASLQRWSGMEDTMDRLKQAGSSSLNVIGGGFEEKDARRELAAIWILSDAADKKAQQPMLKKQLAQAGYMAIEMPKKVFDSYGLSSGVRMDGQEMVINYELEEERLKREAKCRELGKEADEALRESFRNESELISSIHAARPTACGPDLEAKVNAFNGHVQAVTVACNESKKLLEPMKECGVNLKSTSGTCDPGSLTERTEEMVLLCTSLAEKEKECENIKAEGGECSEVLLTAINELKNSTQEAFDNFKEGDVDSIFQGSFFPQSSIFGEEQTEK